MKGGTILRGALVAVAVLYLVPRRGQSLSRPLLGVRNAEQSARPIRGRRVPARRLPRVDASARGGAACCGDGVRSAPISPLSVGMPPRQTPIPGAAHLRVMTVNIDFQHHDADKLVALIKSENPDVLVMEEGLPQERRAIAQRVGSLPLPRRGRPRRARGLDRQPLPDERRQPRIGGHGRAYPHGDGLRADGAGQRKGDGDRDPPVGAARRLDGQAAQEVPRLSRQARGRCPNAGDPSRRPQSHGAFAVLSPSSRSPATSSIR